MRRGARLTGSRRRRYWSRATVRLPHWPEKRPFRPRSAHSVRAARPLEKARFVALADPQRIEALDPFDPPLLDAELSEEQRLVRDAARPRSDEHTSELLSLNRITYAVLTMKRINTM